MIDSSENSFQNSSQNSFQNVAKEKVDEKNKIIKKENEKTKKMIIKKNKIHIQIHPVPIPILLPFVVHEFRMNQS